MVPFGWSTHKTQLPYVHEASCGTPASTAYIVGQKFLKNMDSKIHQYLWCNQIKWAFISEDYPTHEKLSLYIFYGDMVHKLWDV